MQALTCDVLTSLLVKNQSAVQLALVSGPKEAASFRQGSLLLATLAQKQKKHSVTIS